MCGWEGLLVLSRTPVPVRTGPRPASVLEPTRNPALLLQVCSALFLFLLALDNPILLVGHLVGRVRKRGSLKVPSCGLRKDILTVFFVTPSALPVKILGSKGKGDRNKIPMPNTMLLTPRHSGNSPLISRKQITGKERGCSGGEGSSHVQRLPSLAHTLFHTLFILQKTLWSWHPTSYQVSGVKLLAFCWVRSTKYK